MMRRWKSVASLLGLAVVCCSCAGPAEAYVQADRATYEAIAPEYRAYVEADEDLDEAQVQRRIDLLSTWEARIRAAEETK